LGDRRSDGESSCNSGDGTGQMAQPWMFMMMMMMMMMMISGCKEENGRGKFVVFGFSYSDVNTK
jgi:DnaJ-class molecular chaperone